LAIIAEYPSRVNEQLFRGVALFILVLMITRYNHGDLVWIDLESPSHDEVRCLMEEFSIDPSVAEEVLSPTMRPRVEDFGNHVYVILHFPVFKQDHHLSVDQEIDFIIGEDFIITVRYEAIDPLFEFSKQFEVDTVLDGKDMTKHAGYVFFYMARSLYKTTIQEIEYLSDTIVDIEDRIFHGQEREMVVYISEASRELLNLKRILGMHPEILKSLEKPLTTLFKDFEVPAQKISGEFKRVHHELTTNMDILSELRNTNDSLVSTKQNETMKVLTILAFITFPLSLIAGIFGMNTISTPVLGHPYDFWIVIWIMIVAVLLMFFYFKHKNWL